MMGMAADALRRTNLSLVLGLLHDVGSATRADITAETSLNRSTIGILVHELEELGLVREGAPRQTGNRGRPSPVVTVRSRATAVLALDVKVDSIAAGVVGLGCEVLAIRRQHRPRARTSFDTTVGDLVDLVHLALGDLDASPRIVAMSVSVVGLVNNDTGAVDEGPNLGWSREPLADRLTARLGMDVPVLLVNDGDAGVWAERRRGAAVGVDDVLYLAGEVGLGGGILAAGVPLMGSVGYAGEIGHMVLDPEGPGCRCGSTGCMEVLVGENALLRWSGRDVDGGQAAVDEVLQAFVDGEEQARAGVARVGDWLAVGIVNLVNILNPRMVVLGDLHARLHPHVVDGIHHRLLRRSLVARRSTVDVVAARLGQDASLLGAAELALQPLLADPAGVPRGPAIDDLVRVAAPR